MKRSALSRSASLPRSPLRLRSRSRALRAVSPRRQKRLNEYSPQARELIEQAGRCERCGSGRHPLVVHHTGGRSEQRLTDMSLCVVLCSSDPRDGWVGCHEHVHAHPEESYRDGWLVSRLAKDVA